MKAEQIPEKNRDYSSISPSARSLLFLKGLTDIPFALEAAELISQPQHYVPDFSKGDITLWARVLHFEARYKSINQLLSTLPVKNILELSSGFSFRGLDMVADHDINYIDTDLPDVIATKLNILQELQYNLQIMGTLETLPLNALDETAFNETVDRFPDGEMAIVNEGLLVYLNMEEKKKLCSNIRSVLQKRGGCWITADIYIKSERSFPDLIKNDQLEQFFREHRIEENKFDSFEAAETFFKEQGFVIEKEAEREYQQPTSLKYLMACATEEQLNNLKKAGRIRATWRLKLAR